MTDLYLRKASLIVGDDTGNGIDLSDMQFQFKTMRGDLQTPNSCVVRVFNLSEATIQKMKKAEYTKLTLQGGYSGNYGIIFKGGIKYAYKGRINNVDSYLDFVAADGDSAYNFAVISKSLAAGSTPADHVDLLTKEMETYGVTEGYIPELANVALPRGRVFFGFVRDHMRNVAGTNNCTWSIQDGKATMILQTSFLPDEPIVLTSATGLVGFPEQTPNGIIMRSLLNPAIKIGSRVKIDNALVQRYRWDISLQGSAQNLNLDKSIFLANDGIYKVLFAVHEGDTRGPNWYTTLTTLAVNASIPAGSPLIGKAAVNPYAAS